MFPNASQDRPMLDHRILCTPSSFAKSTLLYIQEIGELETSMPYTSRRENLSSYLCISVKSGSGTIQYKNTSYPLSVDDFVFIDCKNEYAYQMDNQKWTLRWIHFNGPIMKGIFEKYIEIGGQPVFHPHSPTLFDHLWEQLYSIANVSDSIRDMRIHEGLSSMLTLLMEYGVRADSIPNIHAKKNSLQHIRTFLDQHFMEKITLDQLADHFFMNKYYLAHTFKEQFGVTIVEYTLTRRITEAKELLRFTDMTAETIGAACGMSDANYFSRIFKKVEGLTPSQYRKLWQN